jgi:hypothetical protein
MFGFGQAAFAQTDPPDRVARLNYVQGSVSFLPSGGDENDWVAATVNRPLTTGDRLWADANSRAELHIGSTAIRMDASTGIFFLDLDDTNVQIRLSDGSLIVRLRGLDPNNTFEVDTPNLAFSILRPGNYRIDAHPDNNDTIVTVRQGEGEVVGGGRSWRLISDQQAEFRGTDTLSYDLRDPDSYPLSDFDRWARTRDGQEDRVVSARYVSPQMTGYEDLDAYGQWRSVPGYGWSWFPAGVPAAWAPYRFGHWVWIAPWGWTWVEDEPWGFAPFHYGRWAFYSSAWMWIPGPVAVRPCYAPALVAWVGGSGFNFGIAIGGGGGVGWFPLGPHEVFVPPYRVSERYVTNINVTNTVVNRTTVVNIYNNPNAERITYVNRTVPTAVTVVSRDTFVNARPVMRNVVNVPARELATAPVTRTIAATPERTSTYGAGSHNVPRPPAAAVNRPVIVKRSPPAVESRPSVPQKTASERPPNQAAVNPAQNQQKNERPPNRAVVNPAQNQQKTEQPSPTAAKPQQEAHPLARQAPPVQAPTAKEQADRDAKQKAWEKTHQQNHPEQKKKLPASGQ